MTQLDLFTATACGDCRHLGEPIDSGIRYCRRLALWRWAWEQIDCPHWSAI